jgi:hypothetical protein
MKTVADFGVVIGMFGAALAAGVPLSARVYRPPASTLPAVRAVSRVGALIACVGGALVLVALLTGTTPG